MSVPFLTTILLFFKALGAKIAGKAIDTCVDQVLTRKQRRQEKEQHDDIQQTTHRIEELLVSRLENEDLSPIRSVASELRPLIESLHVKTAHEILDNLRKTIVSTDRKTMSRIDYYRACCSRYVNRQQAIDEINLAHQEMIDFGGYDPDIVAAMVYAHCISNEPEAAKQASDKLKTISRKNIWGWVPDLLYSKDLALAYSDLPEDIDSLLVLATSCSIGNNSNSLGVDIDTYQVQIPENLTYENIPLWTFNLSILINRFIPEWNHESQRPEQQVGEATELLYSATTKLLALHSKTELSDLLSDLEFWHAISGCQIDPTDELLEILRTCKCGNNLEEYRVVAYANILSRLEHYEEAKQYLNQTIITPAVLNQRFLLSLQTVDPEYAVESFKIAASTQVAFPSILIIYALSAIKNFPEFVTKEAPKLHLESEADTRVYQQICKYYAGDAPDLKYLLDNRNQFEKPFQPFVAIILHANGHVDESIALMKECLSDRSVELVNCMYVDLLEQTPTHASELYEYLRHIREDFAFTQIPRFLLVEYNLASRLSDFPRMLAVSKILHEANPTDPKCFICYLQSLVHTGDDETLINLIDKLPQYHFTPSQVHTVFSQLVLSGHPQPAIDLLYLACLKYPTNEELSLTFFNAAINPSTAAIINKENPEVVDGSYIHYTVNGEAKSTLIDKSNRLSFLIGHKKGEVIQQPDWREKTENYEITGIYNKYYQLSEQIHRDIADNKYNAIKSIHFTDDELKTGKLFEELHRIAGQDGEYHLRRQETLLRYKQGDMPLLAFVKDDSLISDVYYHLFGDFHFFGFTASDFDTYYKSRQTVIDTLQPVLDLPSVILLYELERKFKFALKQKFVVPSILVHHFDISLQNEMYGSPSGVFQHVVDILAPNILDENWLVSRLNSIKAWIVDNAQIEDTTDRLNIDPTVFRQSLYITLFYDCFSLVKAERVLICSDKALLRTFAGNIPVADVNYLLHNHEKYSDISHFFMEANIYGGDLDADFVYNEYLKYASGKPSLFLQCKENLLLCPNLLKTTVLVCDRISRATIFLAADSLIVDELMSSLFKELGRLSSLNLLREIVGRRSSTRFKLLALQAYKSVYPIVD